MRNSQTKNKIFVIVNFYEKGKRMKNKETWYGCLIINFLRACYFDFYSSYYFVGRLIYSVEYFLKNFIILLTYIWWHLSRNLKLGKEYSSFKSCRKEDFAAAISPFQITFHSWEKIFEVIIRFSQAHLKGNYLVLEFITPFQIKWKNILVKYRLF